MEKNKETAVVKQSTFLHDLLSQYPQYFESLLQHNDQWHIQVIYTQIDRKEDNKPVFTHYTFNTDSAFYFYPASTVKMPVACLALQKLNELKVPGLTRMSTMITDAGAPGQTAAMNDPSSPDGCPTIENYIKKIFLVSDNDAFNRLYEFLGQEYINKNLHHMGYKDAQILHRLNISLPEDENRLTNPVSFLDTFGKVLYRQPLVKSTMPYQERSTFFGKGFYKGEVLIDEPFDFSRKNRLSLPDLHTILLSLLFPAEVPEKQRFRLTEADYRFLYKYMSMKPGESRYPSYDTSYTDAYAKFLLYGGSGAMDPNIRIFNKEGDAYGFLTDVAYVTDVKNHVEFMLSATIYCNSDGIFNDDHYDYNTIGYPFMKNLGRVIYEHELRRKGKTKPDLSRFIIDYRN